MLTNAQRALGFHDPGPCPICGAPHTTCTGSSSTVPVDHWNATPAPGSVWIADGPGRLLRMSPEAAAAYVATHEGAQIVG